LHFTYDRYHINTNTRCGTGNNYAFRCRYEEGVVMIIPVDVSTIFIGIMIIAAIIALLLGGLAVVIVFIAVREMVRDHIRDMGEYRKGI
jgi:hypothetical protein